MTDDPHPQDSQDEWHELDQASVRASLFDLIRRGMPDEYGSLVPALHTFVRIVKEEMAAALRTGVNLFMEYSNPRSRAEAQALLRELSADLEPLGLSLADPESGVPIRLVVAPTPPSDERQSWFQIESIDPQTHLPPRRLTLPLPRFSLAPHPPIDRAPDLRR